MGGPDTTVGCLEARAEGADPQAPDWSAGVEDSSSSLFGPRDSSYSSDRQAATPAMAFEDGSSSYFGLSGQ
ncbi:UNVERIFIED_CONTAM: hypothetical protein FKN15_051286 [Acipenser sinensis]